MVDRYIKLQNDVILKIGNPYNYHAVINTDTGKKILAYKAIKENLQEVLKTIVELRTNKSLNQILKESLTYYITIIYGKCFSDAKVRGTKLDRKDLNTLEEEYLKLHDIIKEIRDTHVAHAGSEEYSKNYLIIEFEKIDLIKFRIYRSSLNLSTFNFNLKGLQILICKVIEIVDNKTQKKLLKFEEEFSKPEMKKQIINNSFIPKNFEIKTFEEIKDVLKPLK